MIVKLAFLAKLGRWREFVDVFGPLPDDQKNMPDVGKYYKEVYAHALTQLGREVDTYKVLDDVANGETVNNRG